jgi:predicted DNA-binding transcriptional regulator AlpA
MTSVFFAVLTRAAEMLASAGASAAASWVVMPSLTLPRRVRLSLNSSAD